MPTVDVQALALLEAVLLLVSNGLGGALALLAWHVSDVDVREAKAWWPPHADPVERIRVRHNRRVVTEDARYGEIRRFHGHCLIALIGLFWLLAPQPVNPAVVWWAVAVRGTTLALSLLLIDKTVHHLIARWRFDHPEATGSLRNLRPALVLAWRDVRAVVPDRRGP